MARKLELKVVQLANGADAPLTFDYGRVMRQMLEYGGPRGVVFDEVVRSLEAMRPIHDAISSGADSVTLTDEQWRTLVDRLATFPFALAHPVIIEFGRMIKDAQEIT